MYERYRLRNMSLPLLLAVLSPGLATAQGIDHYIDLTQTHGVELQSQRDIRWGSFAVGRNRDVAMNRCGCFVSTAATLLDYHLAPSTVPWFPVPLRTFSSSSPQGGLQQVLSFSPVYTDALLLRGPLQDLPFGWGYKESPPGSCGVAIFPYALENAGQPTEIRDEQGRVLFSSPTGLVYRFVEGFGLDAKGVVDHNLLQSRPTIAAEVFVDATGQSVGHAVLIVGWDPGVQQYLIFDPLSWPPDLEYPVGPDGTYESWLDSVAQGGVVDFETADIQTLWLLAEDDPSPIEMLMVAPDGRKTGYDPQRQALIEENPGADHIELPPWADPLGELGGGLPAQAIAAKNPGDGTYRFQILGTAAGTAKVDFKRRHAGTDTLLGRLDAPIAPGQTFKLEVEHSAASSHLTAVSNFSPQPISVNDAGGLVGVTLGFDARRSFDLDGHIVDYTWSFGDGSSATGPVVEHAYAAPGTHDLELAVTDDQGATRSLTRPIQIVSGAGPASAPTERASISSTGLQGDADSAEPTLSGDGRFVAFSSGASNLVSGDTNGVWDVFVRDRLTGTTELVSVTASGGQAFSTFGSAGPAITPDGRFVVFVSWAALVPEDFNGTSDAYLYDRQSHTTELISVSRGGQSGNDFSGAFGLAVSADGRFVAFNSRASDLVPNDTNGFADLFVRDRQAGATERVDVPSAGTQANGEVQLWPSISGDGRYVAFVSSASNLVPNDANFRPDVFVRDRLNGTIESVDVSNSGQRPVNGSLNATISPDGRFVAFIAGTDPNFFPELATGGVFLRDRHSGTTEYVGPGGFPLPQGGGPLSLSSDGRFVAFERQETDMAGDLSGRYTDIMVWDRLSKVTERASLSSTGERGELRSFHPSISADGRFVAFHSASGNFVSGDTNHARDVFVRSRSASRPVADPSGPYVGWMNSPSAHLDFHARASVDFGGAPLTATWDFGDGSPPSSAAASSTVSHAYEGAGTYKVRLVVSNGTQQSDVAETTAEVLPGHPPSLSLTPTCAAPGTEVQLSLDNRPLASPSGGWDLKLDGPLPAPTEMLDPVQNVLSLSIAGPGAEWTAEVPVSSFALTSRLEFTSRSRWTVPSGLEPGIYQLSSTGAEPVPLTVPCPSPVNHRPLAVAGGPYQGIQGRPVRFDGTRSSDADGDALAFHWDFGDGATGSGATPQHAFPVAGSYLVGLSVNDGQADSRMTAGTNSFAEVLVVEPPADDVPPVTVASLSRPANSSGWHRQDVTVMLQATDNDGGSGVGEIQYAASGALSIPATVVAGDSVAIPVSAEGATTITFHAVDRAGNVEADRMVSVSLDKTAPAITCEANPPSLWPPDHKLVDVRITVDLRDPLAGPQNFTLTAVQSSEPDDGSGDGNTSGDIQGFVPGTPDVSGQLRAERSGTGAGRTYALHYSGSDRAGNPAVCTANVVVAHDRSDAPR